MNDSRAKGVRKTVFLLVLTMAVILGLFINRLMTPQAISDELLGSWGALAFDKPRRFKQVPLLDKQGGAFDYERLQDKWTLVFFGFTFCPDICPTTMAQLRDMVATLEPHVQASTQVALVSVDPARDTPEKLREYVNYFSPEFIGLTGEFLNVQRFANQLNAAFQKVPGGGENYTIDHSGQIMLINPRGDYHGFLKPPFTPDNISRAYSGIRNNYELKYSSQ